MKMRGGDDIKLASTIKRKNMLIVVLSAKSIDMKGIYVRHGTKYERNI